MIIKELRQGNFLKGIYTDFSHNEEPQKSEVVRFLGYDLIENFTYVEGGTQDNYEDFQPIQLNTEWLENFGFTRQPWGLVKDGLLFTDPNLNCTRLVFEVGNGFRRQIQKVHQLQNLFFALTGEELALI